MSQIVAASGGSVELSARGAMSEPLVCVTATDDVARGSVTCAAVVAGEPQPATMPAAASRTSTFDIARETRAATATLGHSVRKRTSESASAAGCVQCIM